MNNNGWIRRAGALLLAFVMLIGLQGCLSSRVKESAVLPAVRAAWVGVRADVELGIQNSPPSAEAQTIVAQVDSALASGNRADLMLVQWDALEPYAVKGVQARVASGEITDMVATSLYQRIVNFRDALAMLTSVTYVSPRRSEWTWTSSGPAVAWYGGDAGAVGDPAYYYYYYYNLPRRRLGLQGN